MAYAAVDDVLGRAGRLRDAWGDSTQPSLDDLSVFLDNSADEINALLGSLGIVVPVADALGQRALIGVNADAALLLAIDGTWPGGRGGDDVKELRDAVAKRVERAFAAFSDEKNRYPAVAYLLGLLSSAELSSSAASFWTDESDYGLLGSSSQTEAESVSPYTLPEFARGMKL